MKKQISIRISKDFLDYIQFFSEKYNIRHPLTKELPNYSGTIDKIIEFVKEIEEKGITPNNGKN